MITSLIEGSWEFMSERSLWYVSTLISLVPIGIVKKLCEFMGGDLRDKSPTCHIWWPLVWCKRRYKILICHVTSRNLFIEGSCNFKWELFMVCHHTVKFGGHSYCSSRYVFIFSHDLARPRDLRVR